MKKASIIIMIFSILSKILGFVREAIMSRTLGSSALASAFVYAFSLPTTFFSVVIAAFATGFIPMFTRVEDKHGSKVAMNFMNNTTNVMVLIGALFSLFIFIFTEAALSILLPGAEAAQLVYLVPFLKVTCFTIIFTAIIQLMTGFLHVRNSFLTVALLGFPLNIVIISVLFLYRNFGHDILPYGILIAYGLQAVLILGYAHLKGYRFKPIINFKDPNLKTMLIIALPLIIGSASSSIGTLFSQGIASSLDDGIAQLSYAQKIGGMVEGIFGMAIITVMYPSLSKAIALKQYDKAKHEFGESFISELLLILPASIGLMLLSKPVVQFVYFGGDFTMDDVNKLAPVLMTFALGLLGYSLHNLIVRVFYSYQDMKTPMFVSIGIISVQIALGYVLFQFMSIPGITLGMAVAFLLGAFVELVILMKKRFVTFPVRKYLKQAIKILIANGFMAVAIILCILFLKPILSNTMFLLFTILTAIIVYFIVVLNLHIETVDELIHSFRRKVKGA